MGIVLFQFSNGFSCDHEWLLLADDGDGNHNHQGVS